MALTVPKSKSVAEFLSDLQELAERNNLTGCCVMLICDTTECSTHQVGLEAEDFLIASRLFKDYALLDS